MKKLLTFAAIAALVLVASCSKNNDTKKKGGDTPEPEYVQPIKIDGDFSDWAALDASKVATAKTATDAPKTALKLVKVYADEVFVFVYFEWDTDQITAEAGVEHVPFHIYINGDGDTATGGFKDQFSDACVDLLTEGSIYPDGVLGSYDPDCFSWSGEPNGEGWSWDGPILPAGSGLTAGAGVNGKYELQIVRELYPLGKLADNFSIGFDIQQSWNSVGILPNADITEDNPAGTAPLLQVVTVK